MASVQPSVLVVEDEEDVRELVQSVLRDAGFTVAGAADGCAALATIDSTPFDLAVVDVRLPGRLDGVETVRRARLHRPELKALYVSGSVPASLGDDRRRDDFVAKPFCQRELLGCVFELLLRDSDDPNHRLAAEFGIAEARLATLRQRHGVALRDGDQALADALARDIAEFSAPP